MKNRILFFHLFLMSFFASNVLFASKNGNHDENIEETSIEAESGQLLGTASIYSDAPASGGNGVAYISTPGSGFRINNAPAASQIEIVYASEQSGKISLEIDGADAGDIDFTSNGTWVTNYARVIKEVEIPPGATIDIIYRDGDAALNVDYILFIQDDPVDCADVVGENELSFSFIKETAVGNADGAVNVQVTGDYEGAILVFDDQSYDLANGNTEIIGLATGSYDYYLSWENGTCTSGEGSVEIFLCDDCAIQAPSGLESEHNEEEIILSWTNNTLGDAAYYVEYKTTDPSDTFKTITSYYTPINTITYTAESALEKGVSYVFRVRAFLGNDGNGQEYTTYTDEVVDFIVDCEEEQSIFDMVGDFGVPETSIIPESTAGANDGQVTFFFSNPNNVNDSLQFGVGFDVHTAHASQGSLTVGGLTAGDYVSGISWVGGFCSLYTGTITIPLGPSCSDGFQNGDETGIDCGGSCEPCYNAKILVFHKTNEFVHSSIGPGIDMIRSIGEETGLWQTDDTDQSAAFTESNLTQYDVVVWFNTTGTDLLTDEQEAAFENYIQSGGAFAGIHSAIDTYRDKSWPFYNELVGAIVQINPYHTSNTYVGTMDVLVDSHPAVNFLPSPVWAKADEYYYFELNGGQLSTDNTTLLRVRTTGNNSYDASRPISWYKLSITVDGETIPVRSIYTGLGNNDADYTNDPKFRSHIQGLISWAGGYVTEGPSCFDGVLNGDETDIDCGGFCLACDTGETIQIEAESGSLIGNASYYTDGAASGGQGVAYISSVGAGFQINNTPAATSVTFAYASQLSGTISVFVNNQNAGTLSFTANGTWTGSYATATLNVDVPSGATFEVRYQNGDAALNVDYLEFNGADARTTTITSNDTNWVSVETRLYPNPVEDMLYIVNENGKIPYYILDQSGKKLLSGNGNQVNVSDLPSGIYLLNIKENVMRFYKK